MNNLSLWAKNNPRSAQALISVGHILSVFLAIQVGVLLLNLGIELPNWLFLVFSGLFIVAVCLYPSKKEHPSNQSYHTQRRHFDALLLATGMFLTVVGSNTFTSSALDEAADISQNGRVNVAPSSSSTKLVVYEEAPKSQFLESEKKMETNKVQKSGVKHWFQKRLVHRYHWFAASESSDGKKTLLTILLVLGIVAVEFGLVLLTCSIACNGMAALAVVLFLGGLFGLSALTTSILQYIYPDMPKKKRISMAMLMVGLPILLTLLYTWVVG